MLNGMEFPIAAAMVEILITLYIRPRVDKLQLGESFSKKLGAVTRARRQSVLYSVLTVWLNFWIVMLALFILAAILL